MLLKSILKCTSDTCIRTAESLCRPPETIATLLIGYTPVQNKNKLNLKKINSGRAMKGTNKAHQPERDDEKKDTSAAQMNEDPFHK